MNLIEVQNLYKNYKSGEEEVNAVNDVSFQIARGDFAAIMGHSGSGKSTLLTMLGGLTKPTSGNVLVDSINISDLSSNQIAAFRREYIGFVFQSFQLIPYLTVVENIMLPLILKDEQKYIQREKANTILQKVGLENKANRLVEQLSGGEQQRVAIARAIVNDPLIILADEPTGNLDTKTGYEILELFTQLNNEGKTIIIVTHNEEFKDLTDYTLLFKDGRLSEKIINESDNWDTSELTETSTTDGN
jgi:putative ABC transport system ATP-binding protein